MAEQGSKVCLVITQGEWGGAQRYVHDLAIGLTEKSFDVAVAVGEGGGRLVEKLSEQSIGTKVFTHVVRRIALLHDLFSIFEMRTFFKKGQFDVVHLNSSKIGITGAIAAKLAGVRRIVFTAHGFYFNERMFFLKKWLYLLMTWFSFLFIDEVIAVSDYDRQSALRYPIISPRRIVTIHNGVDYDRLDHKLREEARLFFAAKGVPIGEHTILVGTIGNLYKNKGFGYLIDAARIVCERAPHALFIIIGEGRLRADLEAKIGAYHLEKNFYVLGFIENPEQYLKAFDIYACSSLKEGLPYSIIEAHASGVPIVATNVGGIPEIITGEDAVLVPAGNAERLAEAIIEVFSHRDMRVPVQNKFLLSDMVEQTSVVYGR